MNAYTGFAYVYDEYMDNIPYDEWSAYLIELLKENGIKEGMKVADLGCGTGTVTQILDNAGYECVGIDNAPDMLTIAAEKMYESGQQIIYSLQDMRDFEFPYEMDAMISICDSMNYITNPKDLTSVFRCVKENLKTGGVFIFDLKTIHFFRDILADNTYAENRDESAFVWDNIYHEDTRDNEYDLAVFIQNDEGTFDRYEESHFQHGFTQQEVEQAVSGAGLKVRAVYNSFTHDKPTDDSERLHYIIEKL